MFKTIKNYFSTLLTADEDAGVSTDLELQIATAAMLIEMMHMDNQVLPDEHALVQRVVASQFDLSTGAADALIYKAEQQLHKATDYYQFTRLLNKGFTHEQKVKLIKCLWEVAFVDGHLDEYEDYMVRKVSDLLHLSHAELIKMRNQVKDAVDDEPSVGC